jgi:hypothetical protein
MNRMRLATALFSGCLLATAVSAHADTIAWTDWSTTATPGNPGSATGTLGSIGVSYSGQILSVQAGYPSWLPATSYTGGTIGNQPPAANNAVQMTGGSALVETITFSAPITDPVMAIWSLGSGGNVASFDFTSTEPFAIEAGGPSVEYGGGSIYLNGSNGVSGAEGNGVIEFFGTYSSITFTTPEFENYYDFTVGNNTTPSATPEPGSLSLLGLGLAAVAGIRRKLGR